MSAKQSESVSAVVCSVTSQWDGHLPPKTAVSDSRQAHRRVMSAEATIKAYTHHLSPVDSQNSRRSKAVMCINVKA